MIMNGTRVFSKLAKKGTKISSTKWLQRQARDPLVKQAKVEGLRSRAAFKLREINAKFDILKKGNAVIDLGGAPGGFAQIASEQVGKSGLVIAVDLLSFHPLPNVHLVVGDLRHGTTRKKIQEILQNRKPDVVLSDMAPSFTGQFFVDSEAQIRLCENALRFAQMHLPMGGHFVTKILRSEAQVEFRALLEATFEKVHQMKPKSSRAESTEIFLIAKHYKGQL